MPTLANTVYTQMMRNTHAPTNVTAAESMLYPMTKTDTNSSFWHNAEFDKLMDEGIATTDEAERQEIYKKAEHIMTREDWATTPLYNETKFYLLNPSITGFEMDATFRMFWKNADIQ